jgi:hypothetical protein
LPPAFWPAFFARGAIAGHKHAGKPKGLTPHRRTNLILNSEVGFGGAEFPQLNTLKEWALYQGTA